MIFNREMETMSRDEMEHLQSERLRQTVEAVWRKVPFYQQKFAEHNVHPESFRGTPDIQKLPFTVKKDLRANYPFGMFAASPERIVRLHASSGTSGKPTVVAYTKKDVEMWAEIVARAIAAAGGMPGEKLHNAYGYGLFTGGLGLHYGSEKLGMATIPVSGGNTERQALLLRDFQPQILCSTPSYALNIAEMMESLGWDPRTSSLKAGIFGAEPWSEEMRRTLEERFAIKAVDIYGLSEVIGPGVSIECHEAQNGLHIAEDHFYVEVIDPKTLGPLPDGEEGELVFTSLTKEASPIIRYRTGDLASIWREKCRCGRTTVKMSRVKGRVDDMLIIRGVNVFPSEIENQLCRIEELAPHYQVVLQKRGVMDEATLHVEVSPAYYKQLGGQLEGLQCETLKQKIRHLIKSNCLINVAVEMKKPGEIERSRGKAVRVIDHREHRTV